MLRTKNIIIDTAIVKVWKVFYKTVIKVIIPYQGYFVKSNSGLELLTLAIRSLACTLQFLQTRK